MALKFGSDDHQRWLKSLDRRASSASMVLKNKDGAVLIVKANYKSYWTFPGGVVDPGETPKEAAIRETWEEVGIEVHPELVEFVAVVNRRSSVAQTYQFIFTAPMPDGMVDRVTLQASEIDTHAFVTKEQVYQAERRYGKIITSWADGTSGYIEQTFGPGDV